MSPGHLPCIIPSCHSKVKYRTSIQSNPTDNRQSPWQSWQRNRLRSQRSLVQIPGVDSNFQNRNQFSITSGQRWWEPMLCTGKWVKKVSCGGVFDLAVEQPQLFRKLPRNKQNKGHQCKILKYNHHQKFGTTLVKVRNSNNKLYRRSFILITKQNIKFIYFPRSPNSQNLYNHLHRKLPSYNNIP